MASTNKTITLDLSQFVGTDIPGWLTDYNSDMSKIDAFAAEANSDISDAVQKANSANTTAQAASTAANSASTTATNALDGLGQLSSNVGKWESVNVTKLASELSGDISIIVNKTVGIAIIAATLSGAATINGNLDLFSYEGVSFFLNTYCYILPSGQSYASPGVLGISGGKATLQLSPGQKTINEVRIYEVVKVQ